MNIFRAVLSDRVTIVIFLCLLTGAMVLVRLEAKRKKTQWTKVLKVLLRSPQILHDMEAVSTRGANVTPKPFVLLLRAPVRRVNVLLQLVHTLEQLRKNAGMRGSYPPKMRQKDVVLFTFLGWFSMVFCASVCQYYLTGRICQQLDQIEQVDDWVWALKQSDRKINKSCSRVFGIHPNRNVCRWCVRSLCKWTRMDLSGGDEHWRVTFW